MYYINKIIGWIFSPLAIMFLGLGLGCCLHRIGGFFAKLGSWIIGVTVVSVWIVSCGITTRFIGSSLERPYEREGLMHGSIECLPHADAIVLLGGGVGAHKKCKAPELFSSADRVWQAAKLYNTKKDTMAGLKIFCTGGGSEYATIPLLVDFGVPHDSIWFSEKPRNTEEEATIIKSVLQDLNTTPRVWLVTSAWHMSRAKSLFEHAGFEVIPVPTDFEMSSAVERDIEIGDFFPDAESLQRNSYAIKEWVGRLGYWILGK